MDLVFGCEGAHVIAADLDESGARETAESSAPTGRSGWLDQSGALERLRETVPIGRVGQPEDVAPWFVFLASEQARHVVGIEIVVSGGQLLV